MDHRNYVACKIDDKPNSFKDRLVKEQFEAQVEEKLQKKHDDAKKLAQIQLDQQKAAEIFEQNRRRVCEEKMRQQIRESNESLRQLEQRLRACYVAKGLREQMQERQVLKLQERLDAQQNQLKLLASKKADEEYFEAKRVAEAKARHKHGLELKHQMIHSQNDKRVLYEDFLKEKQWLDEIVRRIQDEHMEELNAKLLRQHKTAEEMRNFQKARQIWKETQAIEMAEENRRIQEYCDERDRQQKDDGATRKKAQQEFDVIKCKMGDQLTKEREEKLRAEQVLQDLYAIEKEEKDRAKLLADLEKTLRARIDNRIGLERQKKAQFLNKQLEEEQNRLFYEEQMRLLAEQDKLHQLSDEKRRRKMLQHRKDTEALLQKRREEKISTVKGTKDLNATEHQEEERRQRIIEEERHKILKEHAAALIGHLPKDILTEIKNLD